MDSQGPIGLVGRRTVFARAALVMGALLAGLAGEAAGETRLVTSLSDGVAGSLRATIDAARAGDEIRFSVTGTILLTEGELVIDKALSIFGPGADALTIDQQSICPPYGLSCRVLHFAPNAVIHLSGMTITGGWTDFEDPGAGMMNEGWAVVSDVVITELATEGNGGGVYNTGTLEIVDSLFENLFWGYGSYFYNEGRMEVHRTRFRYGGYDVLGAAIVNQGELLMVDSTVQHACCTVLNYGNASLVGTDVEGGQGEARVTVVNYGTLIVRDGTISNFFALGTAALVNAAAGVAYLSGTAVDSLAGFYSLGGIGNYGRMWIRNATVIASRSYTLAGIANGGELDIENSTISGSRGLPGAGVWNRGRLSLTHVTLANASCDYEVPGAGPLCHSLTNEEEGHIELRNSIVTTPKVGGSACRNDGILISHGYNIDEDGSCALDGTADIVADPLLAAAHDNGGLTPTHAPLFGSPAIDAIPLAQCGGAASRRSGPPIRFTGADQRGVPRPLDGDYDGVALCDIGAVEAGLWVESVISIGKSGRGGQPVGRGMLEVALFGTESFDVTLIDPRSLEFGPSGARPLPPRVGELVDVNGDGLDDLVTRYNRGRSGISPQDERACIAGRTYDGTPLGHCSALPPPPWCGPGFESVALVLPAFFLIGRRRTSAAST